MFSGKLAAFSVEKTEWIHLCAVTPLPRSSVRTPAPLPPHSGLRYYGKKIHSHGGKAHTLITNRNTTKAFHSSLILSSFINYVCKLGLMNYRWNTMATGIYGCRFISMFMSRRSSAQNRVFLFFSFDSHYSKLHSN